jgi:hypothetical protein
MTFQNPVKPIIDSTIENRQTSVLNLQRDHDRVNEMDRENG